MRCAETGHQIKAYSHTARILQQRGHIQRGALVQKDLRWLACHSSMCMSRWEPLKVTACCRSSSISQAGLGSPERAQGQRGTQPQVWRAFKQRYPSQALCISGSKNGISSRGKFGHIGREACELQECKGRADRWHSGRHRL